ncbi:winged helix-turn-helix domain-containing protein [Actinomadura yumaensis]|uniref:Winged helix-turn-helix domain-containing protein n=2 Tax=Actinomadura yumaensis TaxID=111807 RepID=A0ABW2CI28_9ACTN
MSYRIHFTDQDLARTRLAHAPVPLTELDRAARTLKDGVNPARLDAWRRRTRARLSVSARMALSLIPRTGWSPALLTPVGNGTFEEQLDRIRSIPPEHLHDDLARLAHHRPMADWARRLSDDAELRERLYRGFADLHHALLEPVWPRLTQHFIADRTMRTRHFLNGGVEAMLAQVSPRSVSWNPPVLEVRMPPHIDHDLHLEGQGLLLAPSLFGSGTSVDDDARPQPVLSYPAFQDQPLLHLTALAPRDTRPGHAALAALLGRTRANVLAAIADHPGCTTTELAALIGIAPPSASEHATVLRRAGLIHTLRYRNTALHEPTDLGTALLDNPQPP